MLVIGRKPKETILIGGTITVSVFGIDEDGVKLGFDAPGDIIINREELDSKNIPHMIHERHGGVLVLHRKKGEGVAIGENIFVRVLNIGRIRVKVGIEAPSDVKINRGELMTEGRPRGKERF